jgi:EpsI family protein
MFGNTAVRVYIVAALIPITWWCAGKVSSSMDHPPGVDMPDWTFASMPRQLGEWQGQDAELDPATANATGAKLDTIVNRNYRDTMGHVISMHTAMFDNPKGGVYHSPLNCYAAHGWDKLSESSSNLQINDQLKIPVNVSYWKRKGEMKDQKIVVYWYQLGEHVIFGRWDLGIKVRWSLAGKPTWPALIKVMMEMSVADPEEAKTTILGFAEQVAKWENQPSHRNGKGMLGGGEATPGKQPVEAEKKSTSPP